MLTIRLTFAGGYSSLQYCLQHDKQSSFHTQAGLVVFEEKKSVSFDWCLRITTVVKMLLCTVRHIVCSVFMLCTLLFELTCHSFGIRNSIQLTKQQHIKPQYTRQVLAKKQTAVQFDLNEEKQLTVQVIAHQGFTKYLQYAQGFL